MTRHGWLIAIACAYLYIFPYFPEIHSANELPRVYLTRAIVDEGRVAIDTGVKEWGSTADVSPSNGHQYSNKAPGSSFLAAPAYAVAKLIASPGLDGTIWVCRVFAGILPALAFLWLLWGFLERFAPDPAIRRLVVVAYGLGSMAMTYSMLFFSHQLGAVCVGSAWILALDVTDGRRSRPWMVAAGAFAGAALLVDYQAVFAAVPVAVLVIVRLKKEPPMELGKTLGAALVGAAVPIAALLLYHKAAFGSPFRTGYDASESFAFYHQQGFLGITKLRAEAFWGSFFRPDNGLFALSPWLLLAFPGAYVLWRRAERGDRGIVIASLGVIAIYVLFISSINFWRGGWGTGPRYITAMMPFMLPLVAALLQRLKERPYVLGAVCGTIVAGVAIYSLSMMTFPYWHEALKNPLVELTFRLVGNNVVAPSLGSALGIYGIPGVLPYILLVAGSLGFALVRAATPRGAAIALAAGAALLALFLAFPSSKLKTANQIYGYVERVVVNS